MKRSEMVQKMYNRTDEFSGELITEDLIHRIMSAVLETCEIEGMLAPSRREKHIINENYFVNNWEPEDT